MHGTSTHTAAANWKALHARPGGYLQGREAFVEVIQQFCSRAERSRRELTRGTLEAHEPAAFGAMHVADHRFYMVGSGADGGSGKMIINVAQAR